MEAKELREMSNNVFDHIWIIKKEVLKNVKVGKPPGPDQVYPWRLWNCKFVKIHCIIFYNLTGLIHFLHTLFLMVKILLLTRELHICNN